MKRFVIMVLVLVVLSGCIAVTPTLPPIPSSTAPAEPTYTPTALVIPTMDRDLSDYLTRLAEITPKVTDTPAATSTPSATATTTPTPTATPTASNTPEPSPTQRTADPTLPVAGCSAVSVDFPDGTVLYNTPNRMNVRTAPQLSSSIIDVLIAGSYAALRHCQIDADQWALVQQPDGMIGWVGILLNGDPYGCLEGGSVYISSTMLSC